MKDVTTILNQSGSGIDYTEIEDFYIGTAGQVETATESTYSEKVLEDLAESFVSPIQSITTNGTTYYGVIDYQEGDDWYAFKCNDDRSTGWRVVGIREVERANIESDLPHVTAGDPSGSFADSPDATVSELVSKLQDYYDEQNVPVPQSLPPSEPNPCTVRNCGVGPHR